MYAAELEDITVFQCPTTRGFNHAYHSRCLRNFINNEQLLMRRPALPADANLSKHYRCPVCFKHNIEIMDMSSGRKSMGPGSKSHRRNQHPAHNGIVEYNDFSEAESDHESTLASTNVSTQASRRNPAALKGYTQGMTPE